MALCDAPTVPDPSSPVARPPGLPDRVPPLCSFYLYLSNSCNLRCRHCWITPSFTADGKPDPGDVVDLDALQEAVREAKTLGLCSAKLTGGEPMLHPRFLEIADMLSAEGLSLNMETNGTLLTADIARHLKEKTRIGFISISLDGPDAETHDAFRRVPGAFDAAIQGLDYLVSAGYNNCQVIMSVHRGNRDQVEEVVRLAGKHGAASVKLNPVTMTGRGAAMHEHGEALDYDDHIALARWVSNDLRPKATVAVILEMPAGVMTFHDLWRTRGRTGNCGVLGILGILGTGDIALCGIGQTHREFVYGRLGETRIRDIWLSNPTILALRRDLEDVDSYPGVCAECIFARTCRTSCVVENYIHGGRLVAPHWLCAEAARRGAFLSARKQRKPAKAAAKG